MLESLTTCEFFPVFFLDERKSCNSKIFSMRGSTTLVVFVSNKYLSEIVDLCNYFFFGKNRFFCVKIGENNWKYVKIGKKEQNQMKCFILGTMMTFLRLTFKQFMRSDENCEYLLRAPRWVGKYNEFFITFHTHAHFCQVEFIFIFKFLHFCARDNPTRAKKRER